MEDQNIELIINNIEYAEKLAIIKCIKYNITGTVDTNEVVSAAYEGLILAAKTFNNNMSTPVKFTTYSYYKINNLITKQIKFINKQDNESYDDIDTFPDIKETNYYDHELNILHELIPLLNNYLYKKIIILSLDNLSVEEIATKLAIPISTVYRHKSEAINKLKILKEKYTK